MLKGAYRDNPKYCEAYLTPEEFDKLQEIVKRNVKDNTTENRAYIFSGLIKCPVCGCTMKGNIVVNRGRNNDKNYKYKRYRCGKHRKDAACTFKKTLSDEYNLLSTRTSYWEDIYIKHIGTLPLMRPIMFKQNELLEFDSIDELREYDTSYINNTRSKYIEEICKKINCKEQELTCFKKINHMKGKVFVFKYNNRNFIYNNGEIRTC
jgi:hypothetical protein